MFPPPQTKKRANSPKFRPISTADTIQTTGNLVNPVGSVVPYTNPASAAYGPQGAFGSGLPAVNIVSTFQGAQGNLPGYYGNAGTPVAQQYNNSLGFYQFGNPFQKYQYTTPQTVIGGPGPHGPGAQVINAAQQANSNNVTNTTSTANTVPMGTFDPRRAQAEVLNRLEQGDLSMLSQIPKNDLEALGLTDVASTVQQQQSVSAKAPFGSNSQGQRLDAYGNVWDPATAQRDIYGHAFKGSGQAGRNVRKDYWDRLKAKAAQKVTPQAKQTTGGFTGSYGVVSFNTGNG